MAPQVRDKLHRCEFIGDLRLKYCHSIYISFNKKEFCMKYHNYLLTSFAPAKL